MSTDPQYFVGRHVFKYFEEDDSVWRGTVVEWHRNKDTPENFWVVRFRVSPPEPDYPDGYTEDWDHGEMRQWGIDFIDGQEHTSTTVTPVDEPADVSQQHEDAAGSSPADDAGMHIIADCSYYTLRQRLSWNEIMDDMAISSDDQPLYLKWLKENFRMGNDKRFMQHGVWFPNPLRHSKHGDRVQHSFNAGMRFPRPTGPAWTDFVAKHRPVKPFDASESEMIAELAMANIAIEVYYEWADVARIMESVPVVH